MGGHTLALDLLVNRIPLNPQNKLQSHQLRAIGRRQACSPLPVQLIRIE